MVEKLKQTAMKSKYGKILVVAFFIPEATAIAGAGWGLLQSFLP